MMRICNKSEKAFLIAIENFHGRLAPGLVLGGLMVDLGIELIDSVSELSAIVETRCLLADAVELFTPCSVGNGRLAIRDWGKTALCLYDKNRLAGYRIWLDLKKTRAFPRIYQWQMHLFPSHRHSADQVIAEMLSAGRSVLSWRAVPITRRLDAFNDGAIAVCPKCDEAYPEIQGDICLSCQGESYYDLSGP